MARKPKSPPPSYVFRRHANIGSTAAEQDDDFLATCFVDTGDTSVLEDCRDPRRIIVGRTGTGKSALLRRLASNKEHVIALDPVSLSLSYITNSTVLRFFEGLGVKLDIFYSLLWRHVITVELLKARFNIRNEESQRSFLSWLTPLFQRDKKKEQALRYLEQWGQQFWLETEYRIQEFTTKLEQDLSASLDSQVDVHGVNLGASIDTKRTLSDEQKGEVLTRAQKVVNSVQIKELHEVVQLLSEHIFNDPQEHYYITVDRLDENWVDDRIRYKLIRSLIEEARVYQRVPNVKIVLALRTDLLDRVLRETRDCGFQEEKYQSLYLRLKWTRCQLVDLLDLRINKLIREQYTRGAVGVKDIFPAARRREADGLEYILDRTFLRPREAIQFVNECLAQAEGRATISMADIHKAEHHYSRARLHSLADEWRGDLPNLSVAFKLLEGRTVPFCYPRISSDDVDSLLTDLYGDGEPAVCPIIAMAQEYLSGKRSLNHFLGYLIRVFYQTGVVGVKINATSPVQWSFVDEPSLSAGQVKPMTPIYIHQTFYSALGVSVVPPEAR